jgi:uncharacterized membrane protein
MTARYGDARARSAANPQPLALFPARARWEDAGDRPERTPIEQGAGMGTEGVDAPRTAVPDARSSVLVTAVIGAAVMAALDEIVFHQLLGWHHFYDRSTRPVGLLSDGLLHAAELLALVGGFFFFADLRRRRVLHPPAGWGGFLLGAGLFQLFDGLVDHKVLRLHQIRYGVHLLPYDVVWNVAGATLLLAGAMVIWRTWPVRRRDPGTR